MRSPSSFAVLAAVLAQAQAQQYLVNDLSFGYGTRIAPEGQRSIPNYSIQGRPGIPELLSNKVILTPVAPGNQRGAVWSDKTLQNQNWIADVEFRANGPERGSGNLNIWIARDGSHVIGAESVYTVTRFDGLALVIDQYSGSGGMLRGFLNDGSQDFKSHHNVDNLAFGHCSFAYRNLGRPTQIKLRHTEHKFSVEVAGRPCFESDKIRIPPGYNIGITAASADNPDSFEVFKLVVLTEDNHHYDDHTQNAHSYQDASHHQEQQHHQQEQHEQQQTYGGKKQSFGRSGQKVIEDPFDTAIPDQEADAILSSKAQFADLHNRLQSVNHHLTSIFRSMGQNHGVGEQRHAEVSQMIHDLKSELYRLDKISVLEHRMGDLEKEIRSLRNEISGRLKESENSIKYHVSDKHEALQEHVKTHASSGHGKLIMVIVGSQLVLLGAYFYYKKKKSSPKKWV
ncbi:concanavalin A-like lectin/glucanase domain-containing protein [Podospora australis]|uniref:Concanavalin A-like lectin/glucanase domain-containing protein n=1 Tax=Podospora australis TaxID=1536484 RepID=A0AAN6WX65_9PEZI|nr:concanavalin A-like lectin/glucanase domain-containing protein [Podospora australis]